MQSEEDRIVMHVLHTKQGWPISKIAEEFGVSWRTAQRYAEATEPVAYGPRACPARPNDAQLAHLHRRLAVCPDLRATTLLRELRALARTAQYSAPQTGRIEFRSSRLRALDQPGPHTRTSMLAQRNALITASEADSQCPTKTTSAAAPSRVVLSGGRWRRGSYPNSVNTIRRAPFRWKGRRLVGS